MVSACPRSWWNALAVVVVASVSVLACASTADLDELYDRGAAAAKEGDVKQAGDDLLSFTRKGCAGARPHRRCREAYVALGRNYERRGEPAEAWVAFDVALGFPPHTRDAAVREDRDRAQQQILDRRREGSDLGPVILRYRDEVTDEYTPRSVTATLDFSPVFAKEKDASDLRSPDFTKIFGGLVSAGVHVLVVDAAHGCRPTEGVRCGPAAAHQAWTFESKAKTPVTLEVRAYAQPGEGDAAARPMLEMKVH